MRGFSNAAVLALAATRIVMLPAPALAQPAPAATSTEPAFPPGPATVAQLAQTPAAPADPNGPASGCGAKSKEGFFDRFLDTYKEHLQATGTPIGSPPDPTTLRDASQPLTSPPYPGAQWPLGGSEVIGTENMYYGALMDTIYCGPGGQAWKDSRVTIYGWVEPSMNFSTSHTKFSGSTGLGGNYPAAYDFQPNTAMLDQFALYVERTPDSIQKDHWDWGFRFTNLYGTDYKYTFSRGDLSDQYLKHAHQYGVDPCIMCYLEIYDPNFADGMNIRIGRYISIPDIEAQLAPNNYTFTHSLLYSYDPYTQIGIVSTIKLNRNWSIQLEFSEGNDIMPWERSYTKPTPAVCVVWQSDSGNDNVYPCVNGLNDEKYSYNNIQHMVMTWYHKFNARWHMSSEAWYMWEKDVPNYNAQPIPASLDGPNNDGLILGANGAYCKTGNPTCTASEFAVLNYLAYQIGPLDAIELRNEIFDDMAGQRTGFRTVYTENGLGWQHWFGDTITVRPEIRFERSWQQAAYNNPTGSLAPGAGSKNQFQFATDLIVHF